MRFKNVDPQGAMEIPALGVTVEAGATFAVDDEQVAAGLAGQDSWQPTDPDARAAAKETEPDPPEEKPTRRRTTGKDN